MWIERIEIVNGFNGKWEGQTEMFIEGETHGQQVNLLCRMLKGSGLQYTYLLL